jgi:hypothetical protein
MASLTIKPENATTLYRDEQGVYRPVPMPQTPQYAGVVLSTPEGGKAYAVLLNQPRFFIGEPALTIGKPK